jgi:hypothetical protein
MNNKSAAIACAALIVLAIGLTLRFPRTDSLGIKEKKNISTEQPPAPEHIPAPAETGAYRAYRQDKKIQRQNYIEEMHWAAPDVDWRRMDIETRMNKVTEKFRFLSSPEGKAEISVANNHIRGNWFEKGSQNLAGRMHVSEYEVESNQIYCGSAGGTVWKSDPAGTTWVPLNDLMRIRNIIMIRVVPTGRAKRILVASGASNTYGVCYSDNDGLTWKWCSSGLDNLNNNWGHLKRAVVANDATNTVWLLSQEWNWDNSAWRYDVCIYRSGDAGTSFTRKYRFNTEIYGYLKKFDLWTDRYGSGQVYLLENNNIYRVNSTSGVPELLSTIQDAPSEIAEVRLTGRETDSGTFLYALFKHEETSLYDNKKRSYSDVFLSQDGGLTWHYSGRPAAITTEGGETTGNPFGANSFDCSVLNPAHVYLGGVDCWRSYDYGLTWVRVNKWGEYYGNPETKLHADIPGINPFLDGARSEFVLVGTDGGAYVSNNDLRTVRNISLSGLNVSQYYSTYTSRDGSNAIYAGSQDQGIQRSLVENGGIRDFEQMISGDYGHVVSADEGMSIWTAYPGIVMYFPDVKNSTRASLYNFSDFLKGSHLWMPPLMADPAAPAKVFLGGGNKNGDDTSRMIHITRLPDGSFSSTELSFDFGETISAMACSPINSDYRYTLTKKGNFYWSTDGGETWTHSDGFAGPEGHYFYGSNILPSPYKLGRVYIAGSGYSNPPVFVSDDHGRTFSAIDSGIPNTLVFGLSTDPNENMVFAATEVGPYVYVFSENRWYDISGVTAPDQVFWTVDYVPAHSLARFGTYGRGIWDFIISRTSFPNKAPSAYAGVDQVVRLGEDVILDGMVQDDGLPDPSMLTAYWSKRRGPGDIIFTDPARTSTTARFSSAGDYVIRLTASDGELSDYHEILINVGGTVSNGAGFETGNFSELNWTTYGDEQWFVTSGQSYSGDYSAQAGSIAHDERSALEVTLNCISGDIRFYYRVSSESGFDCLRFYIDDDEQDKWSGEDDWTEVSFPVSEGRRNFKWVYSKDSSASDGDDTAWIDDIVVPVN